MADASSNFGQLELSARAYNVLQTIAEDSSIPLVDGCRDLKIEQVAQLDSKILRSRKNCGSKTFKEIRNALTMNGMRLAPDGKGKLPSPPGYIELTATRNPIYDGAPPEWIETEIHVTSAKIDEAKAAISWLKGRVAFWENCKTELQAEFRSMVDQARAKVDDLTEQQCRDVLNGTPASLPPGFRSASYCAFVIACRERLEASAPA